MAIIWTTFAVGIMSVSFCFFSVRMLYKYINRYRFDESKYTLLFGFLRLRYIATAYIILSVSFAFVSSIFMIYVFL